MTVQSLAVRGNLQLVREHRRRFPGLLVQGDTLYTLLEDLDDEAPRLLRGRHGAFMGGDIREDDGYPVSYCPSADRPSGA